MEFYVIDFETSCRDKSSICQVGLVYFIDGKIKNLIDELVNPNNKFEYKYHTEKHGITQDDVRNSPSFKEIYPLIKKHIENKFVFNHNNSDKNFFESACNKYNLEVFNIKWLNSLTLAKRTWKVLDGGHSVMNIAKHLNINYIAHDAISDCIATAKIIEISCKIKSYSMNDWENELLDNEMISRNSIYKNSNPSYYNDRDKITGEILTPPNLSEISNKTNPFFGKKVVVTGIYDKWPNRNELCLLLKNFGADIDSVVGRKTDFLIVGKKSGPSKQKKMKEKIKNGEGGQIIDEIELQELIKL